MIFIRLTCVPEEQNLTMQLIQTIANQYILGTKVISQRSKVVLLTHAYVLWAANVLLAFFAPAFLLSLLRQEIRPQPAQAHSLSR